MVIDISTQQLVRPALVLQSINVLDAYHLSTLNYIQVPVAVHQSINKSTRLLSSLQDVE